MSFLFLFLLLAMQFFLVVTIFQKDTLMEEQTCYLVHVEKTFKV